MKYAGTLTIAAKGDRELTMRRRVDAPPARVFAAFITPALMRRWMLGAPGTTMPVCEVDARAGGAYRTVWRDAAGVETSCSGHYREVVPPFRFVGTERFEPPWYPGEGLATLEFVERDGGTEVITTIRYESTEARDGVLKTPMAGGVTQSYDRLAAILDADKADGDKTA